VHVQLPVAAGTEIVICWPTQLDEVHNVVFDPGAVEDCEEDSGGGWALKVESGQ